MNGDGDASLGQRIAVYRRLRGLTQEGLAQRLHRSTSWVTKVERGVRRVDSMSIALELARALDVPLPQLIGRSNVVIESASEPDGKAVAGLRRILDRSAAIRWNEPTDEARSAAALQREAVALRSLYNTSSRNFSAVVPLLPGLIHEAELTTRSASDTDRPSAYAALSTLYRLASLELRQHGDLVRARLAIDRALTSADLADDELLPASVAATLTVQLMMQGDPEDGVALALDAARHVRRQGDGDRCHGLVISGALHLYAAQAAALANDETQAHRLLKMAADAGHQLGRDHEHYCLIFGPTNVAIQESGILVDLGRPAAALECARRVRLDQISSVNRAAYHRLHIARAHGMLGDTDAAIAAIWSAQRVAPELVRHDPLARDLLREALRRKRRISEQLRRLARDLQVLD